VNYSKIYSDLIESAKLRPNLPLLNDYMEKHHIIPRSMGGSNSKDNIVSLTAREHFVAHWLLWRIHRNREMACAFSIMSRTKNKCYYSSRGYEAARKAIAQVQTGKKHTQQARLKISLGLKGRVTSEETKKKLREINLGKKHAPRSQEARKKISEHRKGKTLSEETKKKLSQREITPEWRQKMSESAKKRKRISYSPEHRQKISEANKKRVFSEETRRKIGEASRLRALKKRGAKNGLDPS
jgi:hypothetical protein